MVSRGVSESRTRIFGEKGWRDALRRGPSMSSGGAQRQEVWVLNGELSI